VSLVAEVMSPHVLLAMLTLSPYEPCSSRSCSFAQQGSAVRAALLQSCSCKTSSLSPFFSSQCCKPLESCTSCCLRMMLLLLPQPRFCRPARK